MQKYFTKGILLIFTGMVLLLLVVSFRNSQDNLYRSPEKAVFSPSGQWLAVNDLTAQKIYLISTGTGKVTRELQLKGKGQDIIWLDDNFLLVSEYETGHILKIRIRNMKVVDTWYAGPNVFHMALHKNRIWAGLYGLNKVVVMDIGNGSIEQSIDIPSLPWSIAIAEKQGLALVANLTPASAANSEDIAVGISLIDLNTFQKVKDVILPHGSANLRHLKVSADGKWAYAVHTRGKVTIPTSQVEKGWVNTNMLSIIDLENREWYASVLLDLPRQGAADPWDVIENPGTGELIVSIAGTNELARIKIIDLHQYLSGGKKPSHLSPSDANAFTAYNVWDKISNQPEKRVILQDQLSAMYAAELITRENLPVKAPRGIDISPDGNTLAIAGYYTGNIALLDLETQNTTLISLGSQPEPDLVRTGEIAFHDGTRTLENWLSCFTCHPDTRADGLNWDLLNDGMGNPKNTKSLVWTHRTPPVMSTGVRSSYEVAVEKGFHFIQFYQASQEETNSVIAYLASVEADISPWKKLMDIDPAHKASVERGKQLFAQSDCMDCHSSPLFTDLKKYNFGIADELGINEFDTPTLIELWRTAPYWHNGSMVSLREMLTDERLQHSHGNTTDLTDHEIDDLVNFLLTL